MRQKFTFLQILTLFILALVLYDVGREAFSAVPPDMIMKTETGEIVLTHQPCEFIKMGLNNYPYSAYATEKGHANHEGCWRIDVIDRTSAILIYFPEIDATGVYNPELFSPRTSM